MKLKPQVRHFQLDRDAIDEESRTVRLSFSSEEPVERFFGEEILVHDKVNARLDRLNNGANLLINHRMDDWAGRVESAEIGKDRRGHAVVRFSKGKRGQEIFDDVRDGILTSVSFMYRIHEVVEDTKKRIYRVTDWEPFEISLVTIPADATVGVGRAAEHEEKEVRIRTDETADEAAILTQEEKAVSEAEKGAAARSADQGQEKDVKEGRMELKRDEKDQPTSAVEIERGRKRGIENLAKANAIDDQIRDYWIGAGMSLEQVSDDLLRIKEERGKTNPQSAAKLDMSRQDAQRFSLRKAILACAEKDWGKAGFELECSRAVAEKLNKVPEPTKFYVPFDVLEREFEVKRQHAVGTSLQRDLTVATAGQGGYLVETANVGFIEMLRNRSVVFRMGARRLSGLVGSVTIPRQSAAATAYWLSAESTQITESQQTFVQVGLSPKTVGAYTEISRLLLLQSSPGAEGIVTADLAQVCGLAVDLAAISGSGASGQPTGIVNTSGIGSVTGTSLAYSGVLEFQTDVASSNVTPMAGGYVTTPAVAADMMVTEKVTNSGLPVWDGNVWNGTMAGFPAMSSNQMASATMLFGDWQELVVGEWGVLEVEVNPYANFQAGIIGVRAMYSIDVGVRRPFAFSYASSIT